MGRKADKKVKVKIDEATGLPVLPEGQYWEVSENGSYLEVAIRELTSVTSKKRKWIFFTEDVVTESVDTIDKNWIDLNPHDKDYNPIEVTEEWLREAVLEKAIDLVKEILEVAEKEAAFQSVIGKYPPKKL